MTDDKRGAVADTGVKATRTTDDYVPGEEVTADVQVRRPSGVVISTRLERDLADRLLELSESSGKKLSQVVREAIEAFIERTGSEVHGTMAAQISMGTDSANFNAVFTVRNNLVTNSPLLDHEERVAWSE